MLEVGSKAPEFNLVNDQGETISLKSLQGQKVVLYFYPKDDTPGCTKEAQGFTELQKQFSKKGYVILGVSKDDQASHQKFIKKYDIGFHLLTDPENALAKEMGAWGEKNMYGKKSMGLIRSTFVIDEKGMITQAIKVSRAAQHPEKLLCELN